MTDSKPLNCPCCGSTATVEPHLIEAGVFTADQTWPAWWTASVNCDSCALQFIGGGDTEEEAVEDALEGWNRRAATALMRDLWETVRLLYIGDGEHLDGYAERLKEFGIEVE